MSRLLVALLVILAICFVSTQPSCPVNEVWNDCGTACSLTCEEPNPKICTLQCIQGCECAEGYLRNKWQKCVRPADC